MYCNMLDIAAKLGPVSDMLFIVLYFYTTGRYRKAISTITETKLKLGEPGLIYLKNWDPESYVEAVGGQSWSMKMRKAVAGNIVLHVSILYIPELIPEQVYSSKIGQVFIIIPPFVLVHMLEFLCYNYTNSQKARAALQRLQNVVIKDRRIPYIYKDISCNILGICLQMSGNLGAALGCYVQSLKQVQWNRIRKATAMRMIGVIFCIRKMCEIYISWIYFLKKVNVNNLKSFIRNVCI